METDTPDKIYHNGVKYIRVDLVLHVKKIHEEIQEILTNAKNELLQDTIELIKDIIETND